MSDGRRGLLAVALLAFAVLGALVGSPLAAREVPYLSGRVVDEAGLLPGDSAARIEAQLAELEAKTGSQVAVLTIDTLGDEPLEDYSHKVASAWKLGRGKFDDGALFLVVRDDRKMRIEVGYGLEGTLPDALASRILTQLVRPRFKAGDFAGGIEAGVQQIVGTLEGTLPPLEDKPEPAVGGGGGWTGGVVLAFLFLATVGVFSFTALFTKGPMAWVIYLFLTPFWAIFPMAAFGASLGVAAGVGWLVGFPILRALFFHSRWGERMVKQMNSGGGSSWGSGGGWSSGGGSWSGGGGGGFSGGGGSFGGGGASSSW